MVKFIKLRKILKKLLNKKSKKMELVLSFSTKKFGCTHAVFASKTLPEM